MKWNMNKIKCIRGCYNGLICQFDGKGEWYYCSSTTSMSGQKAEFRELGIYLGAKSCEVRTFTKNYERPWTDIAIENMRAFAKDFWTEEFYVYKMDLKEKCLGNKKEYLKKGTLI